MNRLWRVILVLCATCLLQACALAPSNPAIEMPALTAQPDATLACRAWLTQLDALIQSKGLADAQDQRVEGFAYARTSRFLASWRQELSTRDERFDDWAGMLVERGREGLLLEWRRLPAEEQRVLTANAPKLGVADAEKGTDGEGRPGDAVVRRCIDLLARHDLQSDAMRQRLLDNSAAQDAYVEWQRWVGLYALTRIPFSAGVQRWQDEAQAAFDAAKGSGRAMQSQALRYAPQAMMSAGGESADTNAATVPTAPADSADSGWAHNALGVPLLTQVHESILLAAHAPVLEINSTADHDRVGALTANKTGDVSVDVGQPTVYTRISHTRWNQRVLLQLNYLFWFSSRPAESRFDLLAGKFDGFVWRVTLDERGMPLVYDTIHACGCYHEFFPVPGVQQRAVPNEQEGQEWLFSPSGAPAWKAGKRVLLNLEPGTHYLQGVSAVASVNADDDADAVATVRYGFREENELRALPPRAADAGRSAAAISVYGPDGLMPGSERLERFLFWPMGIPSAGAQRQWGHHATAFVGRRHFDDPFLFEERFERPQAGGQAEEKKKVAPVSGRDL